MQRLEEMTTWQLKRNVKALETQQEQLAQEIVRLREEAEVCTRGISAGTIELGRLNLKHAGQHTAELDERLKQLRVDFERVREQTERSRLDLQGAKKNVERYGLALEIVAAELRIKELNKSLSMPGMDQRIIIEEMAKLNVVTKRRKEVDDLIPYKFNLEQNKQWLEQAITKHQVLKAEYEECVEQLRNLHARTSASQNYLQDHLLNQVECNAPEYLALKSELHELEETKTNLLNDILEKEALHRANARILKEIGELLTDRLHHHDPIHAAYHEILQEFQHTLSLRPADPNEFVMDLYNKGQLFLDGVLLSERLSREEKTILITDADALIKDLHNPQCMDNFLISLQDNEESLSIGSMIAGSCMIIAAVLGLVASFLAAATGFGLLITAIGAASSLLVGVLGFAMVAKSIHSPVSRNGHAFFDAAINVPVFHSGRILASSPALTTGHSDLMTLNTTVSRM